MVRCACMVTVLGAWVFEPGPAAVWRRFRCKEFLDVGWQHFLWRSYVQDVARPQHAFYTRNSLQLTSLRASVSTRWTYSPR